jgi:phage/plasmid-like protein (TIGR03299 family)
MQNGNRMMYVGEEPWHKLGTRLNKPATAKEAIQAASLDYEVEMVPIFTKNRIQIPNKVATYNPITKGVLGIVSPKYKIVQNVEAFDFFDSVVGEGGAIYHTAGALGQGERIWILAKLPDNIMVTKDDITEEYICLTNSHDGRNALRVYFTPIRVVCQNTLTMSMSDAGNGISIRHFGDIKSKINEARRVLGIAVTFYEKFEVISKQMASVPFHVSDANSYFDAVVFGEEKRKEETRRLLNCKDELLNLFERGKGNDLPGVKHTAWAAYNAVTEYVDHHRTAKGLEKDPTNRLKNIWFGSGANMKSKAFELMTQKIGAK